MYWATTTFRVSKWTPGLAQALGRWEEHIRERHPQVQEVRAYKHNDGTTIVWQEGFLNFHDFQELVDAVDELCEGVMGDVFKYELPGSKETGIWSDVIGW